MGRELYTRICSSAAGGFISLLWYFETSRNHVQKKKKSLEPCDMMFPHIRTKEGHPEMKLHCWKISLTPQCVNEWAKRADDEIPLNSQPMMMVTCSKPLCHTHYFGVNLTLTTTKTRKVFSTLVIPNQGTFFLQYFGDVQWQAEQLNTLPADDRRYNKSTCCHSYGMTSSKCISFPDFTPSM